MIFTLLTFYQQYQYQLSAAGYSIMGLATLFSSKSAVVPIIAMGTALEIVNLLVLVVSKLV